MKKLIVSILLLPVVVLATETDIPDGKVYVSGEKSTLEVGGNAWEGADSCWKEIPKQFDGWDVTKHKPGSREPLNVKVSKAGYMYVAVYGNKSVLQRWFDDGWEKVGLIETDGGLCYEYSILRKEFKEPCRFELKHNTNAGVRLLMP